MLPQAQNKLPLSGFLPCSVSWVGPSQPAYPRVPSVGSATDFRCMPVPHLTCALSSHQPPACFRHSCQTFWALSPSPFRFLKLGPPGGEYVSSSGFVLHPVGSSDFTRVSCKVSEQPVLRGVRFAQFPQVSSCFMLGSVQACRRWGQRNDILVTIFFPGAGG